MTAQTVHDDLQTGAPETDPPERVTRIRVDGRLDVIGPDGPATVGAESMAERQLRALAATADPMAMEELAGVLAGADRRGLRAGGATMEEVLAAYAQDCAAYRNVSSAAATIVRFALQAEPAKRRALQDEAAAVLGLQTATEPGGALHAQRVWLDALQVFAHYLQLRAPEEFRHLDTDQPDCLCLAHLTARANDPELVAGLLGADAELAGRLEGTGLVVMPVAVHHYIRHLETCPRALVEDAACACGLAELYTAAVT